MDVTEPLKLIGAEKISVGRLRKQIKINLIILFITFYKALLTL